jgi:nicotinate-nucleotide adenylyltransferase
MTQILKPIGILGGTFDPIHLAHLKIAAELRDTLDLAHIYFTPCYQPVHRDMPTASAELRLEMVKMAIANEKSFSADTRELDRRKPSYTIDTLNEYRQEFPSTPLCLLMGADAFLGLPSWHKFHDILKLAHIIVAHRPNTDIPKHGPITDLLNSSLQQDKSYIHQHLSGGILLLPTTALDISSSNIRKLIAMGGDPRYLLPDSVHDFIKQHGIYN